MTAVIQLVAYKSYITYNLMILKVQIDLHKP